MDEMPPHTGVTSPPELHRQLILVDPLSQLTPTINAVTAAALGTWTVKVVKDQAGATSILGDTGADVVVSAIPTGRGGSAFLEWIRRRNQTIVRVAAADVVNGSVDVAASGLAHRTLSTLTPPTEFASWLSRTLAMRDRLEKIELIEFAGALRRIPTMPNIYQQLRTLMLDPDFGIDEVGKTIAQDPGLSVEVLRLINSAFFGLRREVANVPRAVGLLGAEMVMAVVLGLSVHDQFKRLSTAGLSIDGEWAKALRIARTAHAIARSERMTKDMVDAAYLGGLLHNIGRLLLAENFPERFSSVAWSSSLGRMLEQERREFGADHSELGGLLLQNWGLDTAIVEAVAFYQAPSRSASTEFDPLAAVHAAAVVEGGGDVRVDAAYLQRIGVTEHLGAWMELGSPTPVEELQTA